MLVEEVILKLIYEHASNLLNMIPSKDEIKNVMFDLNNEGALVHDGFGACFFQSYWEIVPKDVCDVVIEFFQTSCCF
jgi:hypothetical protein